MSAAILEFAPRKTSTDADKYAAAVALQTGQDDPRCDTHWRVTLEREFWPRNEAPNFYETEELANTEADWLGKLIGGEVEIIPPGYDCSGYVR